MKLPLIFKAYNKIRKHEITTDINPKEYPESKYNVVQYIGYKDSSGTMIFVGDVVSCTALTTKETVTVKDIRHIPVQITLWKTLYKGKSKVIRNIYGEIPN